MQAVFPVIPNDPTNPLSFIKGNHFFQPGERQETIDLLKNVGICVDHELHFYYNQKHRSEHTLNTPLRKLYVAILLQALNDLFRPLSYKESSHSPDYIAKSKYLQRDALTWILSESWWERSFNVVCEYLDLDPSYIRLNVVKKFKEDRTLRKKEHYYIIKSPSKSRHSIQLKR